MSPTRRCGGSRGCRWAKRVGERGRGAEGLAGARSGTGTPRSIGRASCCKGLRRWIPEPQPAHKGRIPQQGRSPRKQAPQSAASPQPRAATTPRSAARSQSAIQAAVCSGAAIAAISRKSCVAAAAAAACAAFGAFLATTRSGTISLPSWGGEARRACPMAAASGSTAALPLLILHVDEVRACFPSHAAAFMSISLRVGGKPFVVEAGNAVIRDIGTAFTVDDVDDSLRVDVRQGAVEVAFDGKIAAVSAGHSAKFMKGRPVLATGFDVHRRSPPGVTAASSSIGPASRIRCEVVRKYRRGSVVLLDSTLADMPMSGSLSVRDLEASLDALATGSGLRLRRSPFFSSSLQRLPAAHRAVRKPRSSLVLPQRHAMCRNCRGPECEKSRQNLFA